MIRLRLVGSGMFPFCSFLSRGVFAPLARSDQVSSPMTSPPSGASRPRPFDPLPPPLNLRPIGTVRDVRFRNLCSVLASPDVPHAASFRNSPRAGAAINSSAFTNPVSLCNAGGSTGAAREFRLPRTGRYPEHGKRRSRSAWSDGLNMLPGGTGQHEYKRVLVGGDFNGDGGDYDRLSPSRASSRPSMSLPS